MADVYTPLNQPKDASGEISTSQKLRIYFGPVISFIVTIAICVAFLISGSCGVTFDFAEAYYIQIATTLLGVALSISETVLVGITINAFIKLKEEEDKLGIQSGQSNLQNLTFSSATLMLSGASLVNTSVLSIFWAYTVAVIYSYLSVKSFYLFVFMDILIGIIAPILLVIGVTLILLVGQKVTNFEFQAESVVPGILGFVSFKIGQEYCFWVISKFFYFPVDKDDVVDPGQKLTWIQRNLKLDISSFSITMLLIFNSILPIMYMTNKLFLREQRISDCGKAFHKYDCFEHETREYINCSNDSMYNGNLECYRFIKFDEIGMYDPLSSLIKAIFLFIATEKFVQILFTLIKAMFNFRRSTLWIIMVIIIGLIMSIISIICVVSYYKNHNTGLAFASVLQFTILSLCVLFVGILLMWGSPMSLISKGGDREIILKPMFSKEINDDDLIKDKLVT